MKLIFGKYEQIEEVKKSKLINDLTFDTNG